MKRMTVLIMAFASAALLSSCSGGTEFRSEADARLYESIEQGGDIGEISLCVADGANIDRLRRGKLVSVNMVEFAARLGRADVAGWLIDNGADIGYKTSIMGETLLMSMSAAGEYELCKQLLEKGADVRAKDRLSDTALEYAFKAGGDAGEEDIGRLVTLLLENGAEIRRETLTAVFGGYTGKGDGDCRYGLMRRVARLVRENGVSVKLRPALEAAVLGEFYSASQLIAQGGVSARDRLQILFFTAAFGSAQELEKLADMGLDLKSADKDGNTLLMLAARYNNSETAEYLLGGPTDLTVKNRFGKTALELALDSGSDEIITLIGTRQPDAVAVSTSNCDCGCVCCARTAF